MLVAGAIDNMQLLWSNRYDGCSQPANVDAFVFSLSYTALASHPALNGQTNRAAGSTQVAVNAQSSLRVMPPEQRPHPPGVCLQLAAPLTAWRWAVQGSTDIVL